MYGTLPHLNMKFLAYFAHLWVCKYRCVSELFIQHHRNSIRIRKNLTNTFKLIHRNEQNTQEISYLQVEEFHTLHALSLYIFYLWYMQCIKVAKSNRKCCPFLVKICINNQPSDPLKTKEKQKHN